MRKYFRLKLLVVLILFAFIITTVVTTVNYFQMKKQVIEGNNFQVSQATKSVQYALESIDKAYYFLDKDTNQLMEDNMLHVQKMYGNSPDIENWDFDKLAENIGMDIYVMDDKNIIIYSNVDEDIGLDFTECCPKLSDFLHEYREHGELYVGGIDLEQYTNAVKKYAYQGTVDKQYIFELGYNLANESIFEHYNFVKTATELTEDFESIIDINILNRSGLTYEDGSNRLTIDRLTGFKKARDEKEMTEVKQIIETGEVVTYRYIPSELMYDDGLTSLNVIEIVYTEGNVKKLLKEHQKRYFVQLLIILLVTILVAYLIARWFAKPLYYAYHDSLTGLKNRTALEEDLQSNLRTHVNSTAVLLLDLDNFKLVNDYFGHDEGDRVLQSTGRRLDRLVAETGFAFRLGGDEFVVIMTDATELEAINLSEKLITHLKREIPLPLGHNKENLIITASVGVVLSSKHDDITSILKKADIALYKAKQQGKNQYQLYRHDDDGIIMSI